MQTMTETYQVIDRNLPELRTRVEKLARRAEKLGLSPLTLTEGARTTERKKIWDDVRRVSTERVIVRVAVTLSGGAPVLNGWSFRATILQEEGGIILATVPGAPAIPARFRKESSAGDCEHCGHNRYRKVTYVLEHEDGRWIQVGSTCIRDFLGGKDPHELARYAEHLGAFSQIAGMLGDEDAFWGSEGGRTDPRWPLDTFLAWTSSVIRTEGWVSRTAARNSWDGTEATVDRATYLIEGPGSWAKQDELVRWRADRKAAQPDDRAREEAEAAMAWADEAWLSSPDAQLSDYEQNMAVVLRGETVGARTVGLAGSLIAAYQRHLGELVRKELEAKRQEEAGPAPDGRAEVTVTVLRTDVRENAYGTREVMTVQHEDGWKAWGSVPSGLDRDLEAGDVLSFRATFERKDGDDTFAFFKRPTKPELLTPAARV